MSAGPTTPRLRFGPFELELETGTLRKNGIRIRVPDQAVQVLSALLDRPGQLVGRDELYQKLWPDDVYVDFEHSLNAAVKKLRHALCDSVEKPKFIETIPRRGYKFIATVEVVSVEAPSHPAAVVSPATSTLCPDSIIPETRPTQLLNGIRLHRRSRARVVTGLAALVLLAVMGRAIVVRRTDRSVPFRRINITRLTFTGNVTASPISPDGRHVVYSASNAGLGVSRLGKSQRN